MLRAVREEAREQHRAVGNKLVTDGPPTPEPLTPPPASLLRAGATALQLQHFARLGVKDVRALRHLSHPHSAEGCLQRILQSLQPVLEDLWCFPLSWLG